MAVEALDRQQYDEGVNAAFMRNYRGEVCIAFSDPVYTRADKIIVDKDSMAIHAMIYKNKFLIGHVSDTMVNAFEENKQALLTAIRPDGSLLETTAPVEIGAVGE